jgi:D-3-phosphoglycerate dehydrogenase
MNERPTVVVVADRYLGSADHERALAGGRAEIRGASLDTPADVAAATADADAVLVTTHPMTAAHIAALGPGVRIIGRAGIGLDAIDLDAAKARGVAVYHTPDYCVNEVADQTLTCILMLQRRMRDQERVARTADWSGRFEIRLPALEATTVGVVGAGRIGRAVLARLEPFRVARLAFDPLAPSMPPGVERVDDLDDLLARSDVVTLHAPLTPETRHMLSAGRIARMRRGACLVNVSRGPLVDSVALAAALADGQIAGAAVDVFDPEPPPADHPLRSAPNIILTPHFAWHSIEAETRVRAQTLEAVLAFASGGEPVDGRMAVRP